MGNRLLRLIDPQTDIDNGRKLFSDASLMKLIRGGVRKDEKGGKIIKWKTPMKGLFFLVVTCELLLLTSCGQTEQAEETTDWTPLQIARTVLESQSDLPPMATLVPGEELFDTYIGDCYWFDINDIADGTVLCPETASAQEIAVLRLAEGADINDAKQTFLDYSQRRSGAFAGYLPDEAALLEDTLILAQGDMIALLICREPELAEAAFQRAFTEAPPDDAEGDTAPVISPTEPDILPKKPEIDTSSTPEPEAGPESEAGLRLESESVSDSEDDVEPEPNPVPTDTVEDKPEPIQTETPHETAAPPPDNQPEDTPWSYSSARLLDAWRLEDWSGLAQQDQEILNVCQAVIGQPGFESLSDYEKELAVHDWMLANGRYDTNRLNNLPQYQENPNNDNPYGFLVGGVGTCLGYTSTFQLFMDLLGFECISIQGQANSTRDDHAWNMVQLEEEWYCVDVTWDDPTRSEPVSVKRAHRYFNVTSEYMRNSGHYWDEDGVPEASSTSLAWTADNPERVAARNTGEPLCLTRLENNHV